MDAVVDGVRGVVNSRGANALGAWVSPRATVEEMYLLQGIVRHLGSNNIDHRFMQTDFRGQGDEPLLPTIGLSIADIENQNAILLVGVNIRKEQPIIGHRVRKAALAGAEVSSINPRDFDTRFEQASALVVHPADIVAELAGIAAAAKAARDSVKDIMLAASPGQAHETIARALKEAQRSVIILGQIAALHPDAAVLAELARAITAATDGNIAILPPATNTVGAWQTGILPHRGPGGAAVKPGKNFAQMLAEPVAALFLHGIEPEYDCADPGRALAAAEAADFTVTATPFVTERIKAYSNVVLPIAPHTETQGSYINMEGLAQSFSAATPSRGDSSPGWKVYRVLGQRLGMDNYDYETADEVAADALQAGQSAAAVGAAAKTEDPLSVTLASADLIRGGEVSIYATDNLVRRAASLQKTADARGARTVCVSADTAHKLNIAAARQVIVTQDERSATLDLRVDDGVADDVIWLPLIPELGALNRPARARAA